MRLYAFANVVAICINLLLVHFASVATNSFRKNKNVVTWLHRTMGAVFIALGIRLASEKL